MYILVHLAAELIGHATAHYIASMLINVTTRGLAYLTWHHRNHAIEAVRQLVMGGSADEALASYIHPNQGEHIHWLPLPEQYKCILFKPLVFLVHYKLIPIKGVVVVIITLGSGFVAYGLLEDLGHKAKTLKQHPYEEVICFHK